MPLTKIRVIMYSPFIANNDVGAGPHQSLTMDQQLEKLFGRIKAGYFGQIDGSDVLPLFLAPEWYFSKAAGAYTASDVGKIFVKLLQYSKLFPKALIVGGSIAWGTPLKVAPPPPPAKSNFQKFKDLFSRAPAPRRPEDMVISGPTDVQINAPTAGPQIVYNTVPVVSNGKVVHIYHKRREGGELSGMPQGSVGFQFPIPGFGSIEAFGNTGLFTFQGISFGVEVCADHAAGELHKAVVGQVGDAPPTNPGATGVDVQILVACGTDPMNRTISACRAGGFFVHCEGAINPEVANRQAAMWVTKVTARTKSLVACYNEGGGVTLAPAKADSRKNPDTYRRFIDDGDSQTRVGIWKTVCQL